MLNTLSCWLRPATIAIAMVVAFIVCLLPCNGLQADAASKEKIERRVQETLAVFKKDIPGATDVLSRAKGLLILPHVYKAGIGIGGEYGEGALKVGGRTVDYYNMTSASYGFQLGAQRKSIILAFMNDDALKGFRNSQGWEAGVDASIVLVKVGAEENVSSDTYNKPILGFVIGQKGLMYDLSLEGTKFTKMDKD